MLSSVWLLVQEGDRVRWRSLFRDKGVIRGVGELVRPHLPEAHDRSGDNWGNSGEKELKKKANYIMSTTWQTGGPRVMTIQMVVAALSEVVRVPLHVLGRVMVQLTRDFSILIEGALAP